MTTRIKLRRDTAANWTTNDPILALGEAGYDTTNNELRVGDGTTVWSGLDAIGGGISNAVAIAPEFGPAITFARPEDVATDAVNAVDVIDTGVALGRNSNYGGLLNTLEDNLNGYGSGSGQSYVGQPTHTEWNTDGLADLSNVTTRTYQDFRAMKQDLGDNAFLATYLVMHDTLNDKYYTFKFSRWSMGDNGGDGGYSYVRRLINHTQYFTKTNYGNELDTIDTGLVITRGNNGGLYNDESEGNHDSDVSPQGTEWNIDGWSDLSNLLTRTYTNFTSAFSYQIGLRILGKEAVMHDTINDKYYAVKFTQWTNNNNGGGFTWQRRLIDTTQLDEGIHFGDGTVQTTAGVTFNEDGSLNLEGGLVLPYQNNLGYRTGYNLDGPTLRLSNDSQNQVIVTGPAATADNSYAQRIVIQGQRGYGSTSTQGEGGDVYIWGGVGGETNNNTNGWGQGGGSGGDVKLRGGEGLNSDGGYIRIEAGNVAHFNTSTTGDAGFVEITGGDVTVENAAGSSRGGDVRITGGRAYTATTQSGVVQVITGGYVNQSGDKIWEFGNDGTLTLPEGGIISNGMGAIRLDPAGSGSSQALLIYPTVQDGNHIHLTAGVGTTDLYLGNDSQYVKVDNSGTIVVGTLGANTSTWTFGTDGTTYFPNFTFEAGDGTAGQVLATNGSGSVTWTTPIAATGNANTGDFTFTATTLALATNLDMTLHTNGNDWVFGTDGTLTLPGNLTLPAGGDIRDTTSNISVLKTRIGDIWSTSSDIHQLTIANDEGKLITVAGTGVGVFRLPQMTADMLGAEFEFYFSIDAGQIHIQSYYTGVRETTDVFRGSIYVGVDNATTGKLHIATATTSTACDLFLGQHHAKVGSYVKVKAIEFDGVGVWMFQGMCVGDTGQTPNSSDHPFQDYN